MRLAIALLLVIASAISADAETWYGYWSRNPYAPGRIQPGFMAPPVPSYLAPRIPRNMPPPAPVEAYIAPPPPAAPPPVVEVPPLPTDICIVDPMDPTDTLLNVRASPNGLPIGLLSNGAQVVIRGQAGSWVDIGIGWVFRPLLYCPSIDPPLPPLAAYYWSW